MNLHSRNLGVDEKVSSDVTHKPRQVLSAITGFTILNISVTVDLNTYCKKMEKRQMQKG